MSRDESKSDHFEEELQYRTQPQSVNQSSDEADLSNEGSEETPSSKQSSEQQYPIDEEADVVSLITEKGISGHVIVLFDDIRVWLNLKSKAHFIWYFIA